MKWPMLNQSIANQNSCFGPDAEAFIFSILRMYKVCCHGRLASEPHMKIIVFLILSYQFKRDAKESTLLLKLKIRELTSGVFLG